MKLKMLEKRKRRKIKCIILEKFYDEIIKMTLFLSYNLDHSTNNV